MTRREQLRALQVLHSEIVACRACPRLVKWREQVAREKRRAYSYMRRRNVSSLVTPNRPGSKSKL